MNPTLNPIVILEVTGGTYMPLYSSSSCTVLNNDIDSGIKEELFPETLHDFSTFERFGIKKPSEDHPHFEVRISTEGGLVEVDSSTRDCTVLILDYDAADEHPDNATETAEGDKVIASIHQVSAD